MSYLEVRCGSCGGCLSARGDVRNTVGLQLGNEIECGNNCTRFVATEKWDELKEILRTKSYNGERK